MSGSSTLKSRLDGANSYFVLDLLKRLVVFEREAEAIERGWLLWRFNLWFVTHSYILA